MNDTDKDNKYLAEQYAEIAKLAGGLAHEIKNPLSTIRLNMELLAEELQESEESPNQRRALAKVETVRRECSRLEELLNDFLNFARAHTLQLEPGDLNGPIREAVAFYRPLAKESNIEVIEYLASDLPSVLLDRKTFHRAFLNLMLNAIQSMPGGGELVVRTRTLGPLVAIDLIDTGCGIDEKSLPHLFDAFYSTKRGGSGLGLPTVKKIIEAHGGKVYVQTAPEHGTQFTLTFPSLPRLRREEERAADVLEMPGTTDDAIPVDNDATNMTN